MLCCYKVVDADCNYRQLWSDSIRLNSLSSTSKHFIIVTILDMMNSLLTDIDNEVERRSLLKHKFYQMWSNGELSLDQLKGYSKEYFQLVKIVPKLVHNIEKNLQNSNWSNDYLQTVKNTQVRISTYRTMDKFCTVLRCRSKRIIG